MVFVQPNFDTAPAIHHELAESGTIIYSADVALLGCHVYTNIRLRRSVCILGDL